MEVNLAGSAKMRAVVTLADAVKLSMALFRCAETYDVIAGVTLTRFFFLPSALLPSFPIIHHAPVIPHASVTCTHPCRHVGCPALPRSDAAVRGLSRVWRAAQSVWRWPVVMSRGLAESGGD